MPPEAAFVTRNRRIGVIGTAATIRSRSYETVLRKLVPGVEITARPCPLFVPLVEAGYVDHSALDKQQVTRLVIAQYLAEVREAGVTPHPRLHTLPSHQRDDSWYMGRNAALVDPAPDHAHHLERTLSEHGLKGNHEKRRGPLYVSDVPTVSPRLPTSSSGSRAWAHRPDRH